MVIRNPFADMQIRNGGWESGGSCIGRGKGMIGSGGRRDGTGSEAEGGVMDGRTSFIRVAELGADHWDIAKGLVVLILMEGGMCGRPGIKTTLGFSAVSREQGAKVTALIAALDSVTTGGIAW
jgi:hypothetical protein